MAQRSTAEIKASRAISEIYPEDNLEVGQVKSDLESGRTGI